ncbi:MAG: DUF7948 domain-containing protein [Candidatus Kapaibacteriales bacterium]
MKTHHLSFFVLLLSICFSFTFASPIPNGYFIPNKGQWDEDIIYASFAQNKTMLVTPNSLIFDYFLYESKENSLTKRGHTLELIFSSANLKQGIGYDESPWYLNFFLGNNSNNWVSNLHGYRRILIENILPKIDLNLLFDDDFPRYDFIVKPGGDPSSIKLKFMGSDKVFTDGKSIFIMTRFGEVINGRLFTYQIENGKEIEVSSYYLQTSPNEFSIHVEKYNPNNILVIDPIVSMSYLGGSGNDAFTDGIEISVGKLLATGWTESTNFHTTPGAYDTTFNENRDVFISLLDVQFANRELVFSTFLGGASVDYPVGIGFDDEGNIYVAGTTNSSDFPLVNSIGTTINGGFDIFVTKLTGNGTSLIYSTFLGGNKDDIATAGKLAPDKGFMVTGFTTSTNFPTTGGAYQSTIKGREDIFLIKLSSSGRLIEYATYIGGGDDDEPYDMAVSPSNNIYIVGRTKSSDFPIVPYRTGGWPNPSVLDSPYDRTYNGGWDAFAIKLLGDGGKIEYSTYFGGTADDIASAVTYTPDELIIFAGETYKENVSQPSFPISSNPYQSTHKGGAEIFVAKLSNIITSSIGGLTRRRQDLLFSTFVGGSSNDFPVTIELLKNNSIALSGHTNSTNFPIVNNPGGRKIGKYDLFYLNMSSDGSSVNFSDILGTADDDSTKSFIMTPNGDYYFLAVTNSKNMTTINPIKGTSYGGLLDGLFIKFSSADLRLESPAGKETWCPNTTVNIRWNSEVFSTSDTFNLDIKKGTTSEWEPLVSNIRGLNYNWTIPPTISGDEIWLRVSHKRGLMAWNTVPFTIYQLPQITSIGSSSESSTFCEGDSVRFWVSAIGSKLKFQWFFNNQIIQGKTDSILVLMNLIPENSGSYKVIVSGACPSTVESPPFIVKVNTATKVVEHSNDTIVKLNEPLLLYVYSKGDSLQYQWYKDGNKILGQTQSTLVINKVSKFDKGIYQCKVQGVCGSDSTKPINVEIDTLVLSANDNLDHKFNFSFDQNQSLLTFYYYNELENSISLELIDIIGNRVSLFSEQQLTYGWNNFQIPLNTASGFYFLLVRTNLQNFIRELIIVK